MNFPLPGKTLQRKRSLEDLEGFPCTINILPVCSVASTLNEASVHQCA